jgi:two-component system chemotaxis sensor kinase CheA
LTSDCRLTLAIIDGFLVGVGKAKFVLPLGSVVEVIEAGGQNVRVDKTGRHCVELRGAVLPVVRLRSLYHVESSLPERTSVVVVNSPRGKYGIEVEVLLGQQQTVIKPLGRLFKTLRGISGSSILGSGEVALILDVASLGELVTADIHSAAHRALGQAS